MGIAPVIPQHVTSTPSSTATSSGSRRAIAQYLAGEISEDVFRVMRLNNGVYGQRQGGTNQMVRIKLPAGTITPEQFDLMGHLAETYSRGWGHITTRQNVQVHYVELTKVPEVMRQLAKVGLTSREACGDTVRNVMACHLAGACPHEHPRRHPVGRGRVPSTSCATRSASACRASSRSTSRAARTDCGQAMFNDAGVIATTRTLRRRHRSRPASGSTSPAGSGATPHPAMALEDFTSREDLLPTIEAVAARVRADRQPRQQAARPAEVGRRPARHRRGAPPRAEGAPHAAGVVVVAGRHPRRSWPRWATRPPAAPPTARSPRSARACASSLPPSRPVRSAGSPPA